MLENGKVSEAATMKLPAAPKKPLQLENLYRHFKCRKLHKTDIFDKSTYLLYNIKVCLVLGITTAYVEKKKVV